MARMMGRYGRSFNGVDGQHPCRECDIGHRLPRRLRKRYEERQWRRDDDSIASVGHIIAAETIALTEGLRP